MAVNHQHLRAFDAVASEGSFSRAARRLNISQPTLSQQIKALESRYGQILFAGRRAPLQLTPVGVELHALTRRLFATSDDIEELLRVRAHGQDHPIRLVADSPTYAARLAGALLKSDASANLEVEIANASETLARLLDARADIAVVSDPRIDPRFAYQPLFVDSLHVVLPRGHRRAGAGVYPLACLAHECLLLREETSKTRAAILSMLGVLGIKPGRVLYFHSREAIREAVALGIGVSLMYASECPPDERLVDLLPDSQPDASYLSGFVVCRSEHRKSAMMRWVYDAAATLQAPSTAILPIAGSSVKKASIPVAI